MTIFTAPTLAQWPHELVRVRCDKCQRAGQYRRDRLVALHGGDLTMPDLRRKIADCERSESMADPCGIYYPDLAHG